MATLTVFEDRVEHLQPGLVGHGQTDSVRYEQIAQVYLDKGMKWSKLAIQTTGGGGFGIAGLNKREAEEAKVLIEERIARARMPQQQAAPAQASLAEQMSQLAALRDSGALTEEEFAASKARLLNG
jgi:hypothetical protein